MQRPNVPMKRRAGGASSGAAEARVTQESLDHGAGDWVCVASRKRVLIVDDNDRHLDILSTILGGVGYDVETCGSGAEALCRLAMRVYDVVLLDLVMPEVSGVTVAIEMRKGGLNTQTAIVVCTANVEIATRQLTGMDGIHAIVTKPIDTVELVLAVERAPVGSGERTAPQLRI